MSLSVTKGDGVTVLTMTSDPKSDWPLVCQLLRALCCSPVCTVSNGLKRLLRASQSSLGALQIMVGLFNLGVGAVLVEASYRYLTWIRAPYWLGSIFIVAGIMCILAERFPSVCLVALNVFINIWSAALAITAVVLYATDMSGMHGLWYYCRPPNSYSSYSWNSGRWMTTLSPEVVSMRALEKQRAWEMCLERKRALTMMLSALDIVLIVFAVLQLCVTISVCVLNVKALHKHRMKGKNDVGGYKGLLADDSTTTPIV